MPQTKLNNSTNMASFQTKTFATHDDYMTPFSAWEAIAEYLPKDKKIWECFYGSGESGKHLTKLGCDVIHEPIDFFTHDRGDILVSNPPFSKKKEVFTRLKELGKPFVMICPSSMINTVYFRHLFCNEVMQVVVPPRRIQFQKYVNGKPHLTQKQQCNFDCFYYCWKMNLPSDLVMLPPPEKTSLKRKRGDTATTSSKKVCCEPKVDREYYSCLNCSVAIIVDSKIVSM